MSVDNRHQSLETSKRDAQLRHRARGRHRLFCALHAPILMTEISGGSRGYPIATAAFERPISAGAGRFPDYSGRAWPASSLQPHSVLTRILILTRALTLRGRIGWTRKKLCHHS